MLVDKVGGTGPAGSCSLADTHGASARGPALQSPMRPLTGVTGLIQEPGVELKPGTAPRAAAAVTAPGVPLLGASDGGGEFRHVCPAMGTRHEHFFDLVGTSGHGYRPGVGSYR